MAANQDPLSMGFSRQEYWSGVPLPSPPQTLPTAKWKPTRSPTHDTNQHWDALFYLLDFKITLLEDPFFLKKKKKREREGNFLKLSASSDLQVCVFQSRLIESSPPVLSGTGLLYVHKVASDWSPSWVDGRLPLQNQGGFPDLTVLETVRWSWRVKERPMCKNHNGDKKTPVCVNLAPHSRS